MAANLRFHDAAPRARVGESPVWDEASGRLWWVDVRAPALHRTDPAGGATETGRCPSRWARSASAARARCCSR